MRRALASALLLTLCALGVRLFVALFVANDVSGDGPVYRQIARNVLARGVYSAESEAPFTPTFIRVPGVPLALAGLFALFGGENVDAVHAVQAVVDTGTCGLVAALCLLSAPAAWDSSRRRRAALGGFVLAAACPFTMVYAGTLLTETWALFFGTLCVTAGAWALSAEGRGLARWAVAGLAGGAGCLFRPDLGLLLAALGALLLGTWLAELRADVRAAGTWRGARPATGRAVARGLALSLAFVTVLLPWTVRNAVVFGRFQPLAPATATMPGEFAATGYARWVKSWITRPKDVESFLWSLDERALEPAQLPGEACDSPEERARVAALFDRYDREGVTDAGFRMTPELDAGFGALAGERIRRNPLRYGLLLPARRAWNIWFDTHSAFYPFDGELLPLSELDTGAGQHVFLPAFYLLTWLYTAAGVAGLVTWWRAPGCRRWAVLLALLFVPRLAFLSSMPNPEPRYMVELFPFLAAAGGVALAAAARPAATEAGP
ncbi:MAG: hypothetical protein U0529_15715 [Thermoanaerobaculia bacterium]